MRGWRIERGRETQDEEVSKDKRKLTSRRKLWDFLADFKEPRTLDLLARPAWGPKGAALVEVNNRKVGTLAEA